MSTLIDRSEREMQSLEQMTERIEGLNLCRCQKCYLTDLSPEEVFVDNFSKIHDIADFHENNEKIPIFDLKKSIFLDRFNSEYTMNTDTIDEMLCERFGINVDSWSPEAFQEYTGVGRKLPVEYEKLEYLKIYKIKVPAETKEDEIKNRKIGDLYYAETCIELMTKDISQADHFHLTDDYNRRLKKAIKTRFLCQSLTLTETLLGTCKSPFDEPVDPILNRYLSNLPLSEHAKIITDPEAWLQNESWLYEINDLATWATSTVSAVHKDILSVSKWIEKSAHDFYCDQKLGDEDLWLNRINNQNAYLEYLKKYCQLLRISAKMNQKFLEEVMLSHESAVHDLGYFAQLIVERYFIKSYLDSPDMI